MGNVKPVIAPDVSQKPKVSSENIKIKSQQSEANKKVHEDIGEKGNLHAGVVDDELLQRSVEQANKSLEQHNRYIERKVHDVTKAVMYTLKDTETEEVIAEFPPEKLQDMIAKMWELAGLVIDERG